MDIRIAIADALRTAQSGNYEQPDPGKRHQEMSRSFVERLAELMRAEYRGRDVAVMSKHNCEKRPLLGMNEFLFDIAVLEYRSVQARGSGEAYAVVTGGLWVVESEMAKLRREAIYDFNKLVLAKAPRKLFIGPIVSDVPGYLEALAQVAASCDEQLSLALIPHPQEWDEAPIVRVLFWTWRSGRWHDECATSI